MHFHLNCLVQVADPWKLAEDMMFSGTVVEGTITGCNKRGIYVQLPDLKGKPQQQFSHLAPGPFSPS
jgi:ribosomal protein S1